jgi:chaperone modulatory protein CbpM
MGGEQLSDLLTGEIVDENLELTLADFCRSCQLPVERVFEFVEHGVIEPVGTEPELWRFRAVSIRRVRSAQRLEQDLGVNAAGAALALDLLAELQELRARLARLDRIEE